MFGGLTNERLTRAKKRILIDGSSRITSIGTSPHFPNTTIHQRGKYPKPDTAQTSIQVNPQSAAPTDSELQLKPLISFNNPI